MRHAFACEHKARLASHCHNGKRTVRLISRGPLCRLRAAWRRGADVFAEVAVPDAAGHALHPALLEAALRVAGPADSRYHWQDWSGVELHSAPAGLKYGRANGDLKVTDDLSDRLLRLPMWVNMEDQQTAIIKTILSAL